MYRTPSNSSSKYEEIWNESIYRIKSATYEEVTGQNNPNYVQITCDVNCWTDHSITRYYKYTVTYKDGEIDFGEGAISEWLIHELAPVNFRRPDTIWHPNKQTSIGVHWVGQLNYNTIKNIIPLP